MKKSYGATLAILCIVLLFARDVSAGLSAALPVNSHGLQTAGEAKIDPNLMVVMAQAAPDEMLPVIVTLKERANLAVLKNLDRNTRLQKVVELLQTKATATQAPLLAFLENKRREGAAGEAISFWVFNGLAVDATPAVIAEVAARSDVLRITPNESIPGPAFEVDSAVIEPNIQKVNAPALWSLGYRGQGIVVASLDSGVSLDHPDLSAQYRGGSNSWFDPYGQNPTPVDFAGHGTRTMGVILGRDAGGSAIGVAPDAQWIAVKIFNNQGSATTAAIHLSYQWLLDPDGNPATPDAPHIVNNSWNYNSPGCNLEFELDLQSLRAAGILPVFAAGNAGPGSNTSLSPANNPSAFAVGGVNNDDQIYPSSSRGPTACGGPERIFPNLVAPAVNIYSSDRYGTYFFSSGTSLAAPHISGALALLLSAFPHLNVSQQEQVLVQSALDLGLAGGDNDFGFGRLDILAAYQSLSGDPGSPTPTLTSEPPTATPTFTVEPPTPTSTHTVEPPTPTPTSEPPTDTPTPTPSSTPEPPPPADNLALGKPVSVSSYADNLHNGSKAVDGDLNTTWQTKKKSKLASEWIKIDLGGVYAIEQVVLEWDVKYARSYTIKASLDNAAWTTLFVTTSADGGRDVIPLNGASARYLMLDTTAWSDSSLRNWLRELQILGSAAVQLPGPSSTPTSIPAATPTPTLTAGSLSLHIGDLHGSTTTGNAGRWNAQVVVSVHTAGESLVSGATVRGVWSGGASGSSACTTGVSGQCSLTYKNIKSSVAGLTFTVTGVTASGMVYDPANNHDPQGDSDGSKILIGAP